MRRRLPKRLADATLRDLVQIAQSTGGTVHLQMTFSGSGATQEEPSAPVEVDAVGFQLDEGAEAPEEEDHARRRPRGRSRHRTRKP